MLIPENILGTTPDRLFGSKSEAWSEVAGSIASTFRHPILLMDMIGYE